MFDSELSDGLNTNGYCVLRQVFDPETVTRFRALTQNHLEEMGKTRSQAHSFHLAGFHRFNAFCGMHSEIAQNQEIAEFLNGHYENAPHYAIGLSDITVNRSQHWHTDLLRGPYASFLGAVDPWSTSTAPCLKALLYLQDGKSLRIVPGSHLDPSPLDDDALEQLATSDMITQLEIKAGDVVMMDIRALHRGSTDQEMNDSALMTDPKILVSTVFGEISSPLSQAMQLGNTHRMIDWDRDFLCSNTQSPPSS